MPEKPKKDEEISFPWMGKSMEHEAEEMIPLSPLKAEKEESEKIKAKEEKLHFPKGATPLETEEELILPIEPLPGTVKRDEMGRVDPESEFEKAEFKK